jgi:putative tryptophan/tyrosine transport system substrate-binding protein
MIGRRELITLLGGAAAAWTSPRSTLAQAVDKRPRRIAYLSGGSSGGTDQVVTAFLDGMHAHGYVEGRDFEIDYRFPEGHLERVSALARDLVRSKPDLILASILQAAVAASDATKTIPIVCPLLSDPARLGLIKSDARPGGTVTGLLLFVEGLPGKQLELVLDVIPGATRIGLVVNPDNVNSLSQRQELETAVAAKAIKIATIEVRTPENVDSIFPTLAKERVDAVIVLRDTVFFNQRAAMAASAMAARLPTVYGFREHVEGGGLISYGINVSENFRRAADYVVKILKGAKPGDLPIEFTTRLELVINLKTAKALGIDIPPTLLARADEVIE